MKFQVTATVVITTARGPVVVGVEPASRASPRVEIVIPINS